MAADFNDACGVLRTRRPDDQGPCIVPPVHSRREHRGVARVVKHRLAYPFGDQPEPGHALEVAPGVHWLRMPLPMALNHINLWALEEDGGWTLVDTGIASAQTRQLWDAFFSSAKGKRPVHRLIVTHHHPDHSGNAAWLTSRFEAPLWMSFGEYMGAHAIRESMAGFSLTQLLQMFERNGLQEAELRMLTERGNAFQRNVPEFPTAFRRIINGEEIAIGPNRWRVVTGHGHSPEHSALWCEKLKVLISGDMVLPKITTNVSVWSAEPDGNPLRLFLDSIDRYAELPADTLVLPSHGIPFTGLRERVAQLHEHHRERLQEVVDACREPKSAAQVVPTLFRRQLDQHGLFFAIGESMAHLHLLHGERRLERRKGRDGVIRYVARSAGGRAA